MCSCWVGVLIKYFDNCCLQVTNYIITMTWSFSGVGVMLSTHKMHNFVPQLTTWRVVSGGGVMLGHVETLSPLIARHVASCAFLWVPSITREVVFIYWLLSPLNVGENTILIPTFRAHSQFGPYILVTVNLVLTANSQTENAYVANGGHNQHIWCWHGK